MNYATHVRENNAEKDLLRENLVVMCDVKTKSNKTATLVTALFKIKEGVATPPSGSATASLKYGSRGGGGLFFEVLSESPSFPKNPSTHPDCQVRLSDTCSVIVINLTSMLMEF